MTTNIISNSRKKFLKISQIMIAFLMVTSTFVGLTLLSTPAGAVLSTGDLSVTPDKSLKTGRPGDLVTFVLTYKNIDGDDDAYLGNFTVTPSFPASSTDWNATITFSGVRLQVKRDSGTADANLFVRIATNANHNTNKQFTVSCKVWDSSTGGTYIESISTTVTVNVLQKWSLTLTNLTGDPDTKKPGSNNRVFFNMTVANNGNGEDSVSFSAVGSPGDAPSFTPYISKDIPGFTSYNYRMSISNIPEDISRGDHVVTVTVTSENTSVKAQYDFIVTVDPYYELELDLNETTTTKTIQPGSDVIFNFIIYNKGNGKEKLNIGSGIIGNPPYWTTNVYPFSGSTVQKNRYRDIKITITAPNNGSYPTNLNVYLNVSSQNNPAVYQYTTVQVKLAQIQNIDIVVPSSGKLNASTRKVSFPITVINKGNGEDTFEFSISGSFPSGELWNYDFSPNSITLDSKYSTNKQGTVYLNLTAPEDAQYGSFQITVNSFSSSDSSVIDSADITIIVGKLRNIALFRLVNEIQTTYPGDNVSIKFQGENTGNYADTFYLTMSGPSGTGSWDFNFNPGLFSNLQPDTTKIGYLNMTIDPDTPKGFYIITVMAESATDESKYDTFKVNISVKRKYEIELSSTSTTESTQPGQAASFMFTVRNRGTGSCNVTMGSTTKPEISAYMNVNIDPKTFELSTATDTQVIYVNITPSDSSPLAPMNITTGVPITISADIDERDGGPEENKVVYVKIEQIYKVQIWPDALEKTVKPGEYLLFTIDIKNTGNGEDSFSITLASVEATWSATPSKSNTNKLNKDGTDSVILNITVPSNENKDHDNITINVSSRNAKAAGKVAYSIESIKINVRAPVTGLNLSVKDGTRLKNADPGKTVKFNLSATNTGVDTDQFTFEVSYTNQDLVKEWSISSQTTPDMAPDAAVDVQLTFTLKSNAASDLVNITLIGTSKTNVNTIEKFTMTISVNPIFKLSLTSSNLFPPANEDVTPGTNATFQIVIKNEGTAYDVVKLEIIENYPDITAIFPEYTYSVDPSSTRSTTLTVIIPEEPSSLQISIEIVATSEKDDDSPPASAKRTVVFDIDPPRDVDLSAVEHNLEIVPNLEGTEASIDYDLTVTNKGKAKDSFRITVNAPDSTYASWFSHIAETAKIDADALTTVTITVEVPNGRIPETFQFTVTATSVENTAKSDTETFTLKILESYGVDLIAVDNEFKKTLDADSTEQGDSRIVEFDLEVINIGTSIDNYQISTVEGQYSSWATVSPGNVLNLAKDISQQVTVTVKVKKDTAIGDYKISIMALSRGEDTKWDEDNDVSDTLELWITVTQIYDVYIPDPITDETGKPGELIQFKLTIKNRGNGDDDVLLSLKDKGDWPWTLSSSAPSLEPAGSTGDTKPITLSVVIPTDAEVKSGGYKVNLTLISDTPEGDKVHIARGELTFTIMVEQSYSVKMTVTKSKLDADPGKSVSFRINLRNNGNGYDTFDLVYTIDKGRENIVPAFDASLSNDAVTLGPFDFTYIWLNVSIPDIDEVDDLIDIKADDYKISVHAESRGKEDLKYQLNLNVTINKKYKLVITSDNPAPSSNPLTVGVDDPEGVTFFVTVKNLGNEDDSATLGALDNEPDDWNIDFFVDNIKTTTINLEPGESQRVKVTVTFDDDIEAGVDYAGITAKSKKNNAKVGLSATDRVYIEVQVYSLKLNDIEFSATPEVDSKVTITAVIENVGQGDAEDVVVTFKDGKAVITTKTVDKIEAGETVRVQAEWQVTEGDHNIQVEVDQNDGTTSSIQKSVSAKKPLLPESWIPFLLIGIILLIIILAIMGAVSVKRGREIPPEVKAELVKLRKESDMRKARAELERSPSDLAGEGAALLPQAGKFKELPPGPEEGEEAPKKATKIKCPKCDKIQTVPSPKRPIEFDCDDCGQKLVLRKK